MVCRGALWKLLTHSWRKFACQRWRRGHVVRLQRVDAAFGLDRFSWRPGGRSAAVIHTNTPTQMSWAEAARLGWTCVDVCCRCVFVCVFWSLVEVWAAQSSIGPNRDPEIRRGSKCYVFVTLCVTAPRGLQNVRVTRWFAPLNRNGARSGGGGCSPVTQVKFEDEARVGPGSNPG